MANVLKTYRDLKSKHPDALLLFRNGDFYQLFNDDARTAAQELNLTLAYFRNDPQTAMCCFPYHALDSYLPRLIRAGHHVAICDMPEPPKKLVHRGSDELTTTATNNPTNNHQTTNTTMKLSINNNNAETKNTVANPATIVAANQTPAEPIQDAVAEEITDEQPAPKKAASKRGQSGAGSDSAEREQARPEVKVTIKRKVTLKKKKPISEAPQTQPVSDAKPSPSTVGAGLPQVQFSTYKTKKGDTAPQIIGFSGEDDPRWKAHKDAGHKWVSASYRRDLNGNKVYILLFGTRYMDVAKALAGAYNTPDVDAWHRAEDACMAIYEQAQRDGKAKWEEKKAQWAEKKAEKAAQKAADEQAKKCYTKEDVAAMMQTLLNGGDVPEDIKRLLAA